MPIDFGVSDMLTDEYNRFTTGLADLSDGGRRRAREAAARAGPSADTKRQVNIPGWDDVVHIIPRVRVPIEARRAHYQAIRRGEVSPLSPEQQYEIERSGRRMRAANASASPEWAKAYGQVMTAVDNVQDFLTTVAVVGRLTLNPAIRGLELAGAGGVPLIAPAARVGARTVGRMVPVIGWVLLAGDILRLLTLLGTWAFPFYALLCRGVPAALAAGVPAAVFGRALKLRASALANLSPFSHRARLARSRLARTWRPSIPNLLEVAQTTDQLFGVGVSFGGIVGAIQDTAFAAEAASRGLDVTVSGGDRSDTARRMLYRILRDVPSEQIPDYRAASSVLRTAPAVNRVQEIFTWEEHLEFLAAQGAAIDFCRPIIEAPEMTEAVNWALDQEWAPATYGAGEWHEAIALDGLEPGDTFDAWPLPGAPRALTGQQILALAPEITYGLYQLLEPKRDSVEGLVAGAFARKLADRWALMLAGSPEGFEYELTTVWQILESLCLANYVVNVASGEGPVTSFFTAAERWLTDKGKKQIPPSVLAELAQAAGVTLIRTLPEDQPIPEGAFGN